MIKFYRSQVAVLPGLLMTREDIQQKLQQVFDKVFVQDVVVTDELSAADVDEWDSLTHISLVIAIESTLGVRFGVGEVESTSNVGELIDLILRHKGAK